MNFKNQILFKFFIISCLIYGKYFEYFNLKIKKQFFYN